MSNTSAPCRLLSSDTEQARLSTLIGLNILDTPAEPEFDTIVRTAQHLLGCKMALVSLVDADRQWFKAKCGLDVAETPLEVSFCTHAVHADQVLIVPDATLDARFRENPAVTGDDPVRFYAGVPIRAADPDTGVHWPIGTLCVADDKPRHPDAAQIKVLSDLAAVVETLLRLRSAAIVAAALAHDRGDTLRRLDRTHRQFRQAERMANIGSWRLTLADSGLEWSEQLYAIHGLAVGALPALETALNFYPPRARATIDAAIAGTIATGEPFDVETDFITAQYAHRRVRAMGELEVIDGKPVSLIGMLQDITCYHDLQQALRQIAATDELTRLASRGRFNAFADELLAKARAHDDPLALLLIDLDHFKAVNDRCGHAAGDDLLRTMASRLEADYLEDSFAARLGGDEFVLMITSPRLLADLPGLLRRLLSDLCHSVSRAGATVDVSATIGVCRLDAGVTARSELLQHADDALYQAKRAQRGTAMIWGQAELIVPDGSPPPDRTIVRDVATPHLLLAAVGDPASGIRTRKPTAVARRSRRSP